MFCKALGHKWEVEEVVGGMSEGMFSTDDIELKLRCTICHASLQGKVKR